MAGPTCPPPPHPSWFSFSTLSPVYSGIYLYISKQNEHTTIFWLMKFKHSLLTYDARWSFCLSYVLFPIPKPCSIKISCFLKNFYNFWPFLELKCSIFHGALFFQIITNSFLSPQKMLWEKNSVIFSTLLNICLLFSSWKPSHWSALPARSGLTGLLWPLTSRHSGIFSAFLLHWRPCVPDPKWIVLNFFFFLWYSSFMSGNSLPFWRH